MRYMGVVAAVVIFSGVAARANAYQPGCLDCNRNSRLDMRALCGPPCCSPFGYALTPGCCEYSRPCCENAWDGYCEHRAKVEAFWSRIGAPKSHRRPVAHYAPPIACYDDAAPGLEPTRAIQPAPTIAPSSAGRRAVGYRQ